VTGVQTCALPISVSMKSSIFWDITTCSPLKVNRRLGGTSRLHLQSRKISSSACNLFSRWFLAWLILWTWRGRRHIPLKRRLTFNGLHGVISRNTELYETIQVSAFPTCPLRPKYSAPLTSLDSELSYDIRWRSQMTKLFMKFFQHFLPTLVPAESITSAELLSNVVNLFPSFRASNQILHQCETAGKLIDFYIFIFRNS
jgi:hypothetical protein